MTDRATRCTIHNQVPCQSTTEREKAVPEPQRREMALGEQDHNVGLGSEANPIFSTAC